MWFIGLLGVLLFVVHVFVMCYWVACREVFIMGVCRLCELCGAVRSCAELCECGYNAGLCVSSVADTLTTTHIH